MRRRLESVIEAVGNTPLVRLRVVTKNAPTVGEYVTPLLLGGSSGSMYGNIIQDFFTKAANWPLGSALSMVMLAATLALVAVAVRLIDVRRLIE